MPSVVLIGRDFGCFFSPSLLHFPRLYRYAQGASGQTQSFAYPIVKIRDFVLLFFSPKEEGGRITKERKKERKGRMVVVLVGAKVCIQQAGDSPIDGAGVGPGQTFSFLLLLLLVLGSLEERGAMTTATVLPLGRRRRR